MKAHDRDELLARLDERTIRLVSDHAELHKKIDGFKQDVEVVKNSTKWLTRGVTGIYSVVAGIFTWFITRNH